MSHQTLQDVYDLKKLMEPEADKSVAGIEMMRDYAVISAAISLKRIADKLCGAELPFKGCEHCGHPMTNCVC